MTVTSTVRAIGESGAIAQVILLGSFALLTLKILEILARYGPSLMRERHIGRAQRRCESASTADDRVIAIKVLHLLLGRPLPREHEQAASDQDADLG
jgi:hypothetical protein